MMSGMYLRVSSREQISVFAFACGHAGFTRQTTFSPDLLEKGMSHRF
jgi:hypothetical protein